MKTITKFFIVGVSLVLFGCTFTIETQKPPPDDAVIETQKPSPDNATLEVKNTIINSWPDNKLEFHKAMYFATMAMRPDLRMRYHPINLYNICACIVDILQVQYNYEDFKKRFTGDPAPDAQQEIYAISFKCSTEESQLMKQKIINSNDPKDFI